MRPPRVSEAAADDAIDLAASVGLLLDEWQQMVLRDALGEDDQGRWAAATVGLDVTRQNGKGHITECRELAGLFLFGEQVLIHTAHLFPTSLEAFRRVLRWIEGSDDLGRHVLRVSRSHGEEGIELRSGARLMFRARSHGAGRGFTGDLVVLDEAMILSADTVSDLQPTMSARPNPQLWLTGSAGFTSSAVWQQLRARALAGTAERVAWSGWGCADDVDVQDRVEWARANPALGVRISERAIEAELELMDPAKFRRERLGVWDPAPLQSSEQKLPYAVWSRCTELGSSIDGPLWLAVDVSPDRLHVSVAAAGLSPAARPHVELIEHRSEGTGWAARWVAARAVQHGAVAIAVDPAGPAGSLVSAIDAELTALGSPVRVRVVATREHAEACGQLVDAVRDGRLAHLGQPILDAAVGCAGVRPLGDTWAWSRRGTEGDISPLVAVTLAHWAMSAVRVEEELQLW